MLQRSRSSLLITKLKNHLWANTACTRSPTKCVGAVVVGLLLRNVRVFRRFSWLEASSGKVALSRPIHQYPGKLRRGITQAVRRCILLWSSHVSSVSYRRWLGVGKFCSYLWLLYPKCIGGW